MRLEKSRIKLFLLLLYIGIVLVVSLRIKAETTGYKSPDSYFYLRTADNILKGKGLVAPETFPFEENTPESYMAIWPAGYPALIAATGYVTGLDVFISSKLINLLFLGFIFILLYVQFQEYSLLPAAYFCSFGKLEIYSYTWSEGVFLFLLLALLFFTEKLLSGKSGIKTMTLMVLCLVSLTFVRYSGLVYFFFLGLININFLIKKKYDQFKSLSLVLLLATVLVSIYLLINYNHTGGVFSNHPRVFPEKESLWVFVTLLLDGVMNEFFLARNFYWKWDVLFIVLLITQVFTGIYLMLTRNIKWSLEKNSFQVMIGASLFYFVFLLILRKISPFDAFDYRILAPFSTPLFIVLLGNVRVKAISGRQNYVHMIIIAFFLLSLIMNLPKQYILEAIL